MRASSGARPALFPLLGLLLLLALAAVSTLSASASAGGTPEYIGGAITVVSGETQAITNRTLVVSGDITVQSGGTLELHNASLLLNLTADFSLAFTVQGGGTLRAFDLDGAAQTSADRSLVGSANPAYRYAARFEAGSNVLFKGSAISGFGRGLSSPGLLIESGNVTFIGALLEAYAYLRVEGVSPTFEGTTFLGDGTGSDFFFGSNAALSNCTFSDHFVAVRAANNSLVTVAGALVRDSFFSFSANGSDLRVVGSVINNSTTHLFLTNASAAEFVDVDFDPAAVQVDDPLSTLTYKRAFTFQVVNGAAEPVRNATVTVLDAQNVTAGSGSTAAVGWWGPFDLVAFRVNASGRFDEGNYTATASKLANSSSFSFSAFTQGTPVALTLLSNIDPRLTPLSPSPGAVLLAGVEELFSVNVSDPDATPGGVSVSWRSSIQGALGSGASLGVALQPGAHTIQVEASDAQDGIRELFFNITVEAGRAETITVSDGALNYSVTIWKTSVGRVDAVLVDAPAAPPMAVGKAIDIHPTSGFVAWAWATVSIPFDPDALPYGSYPVNLTAQQVNGGAAVAVPGTSVDLLGNAVRFNLSRSQGLGTFFILAVKGPNLPPSFLPVPTLSAVVGQPFSFTLHALDTPRDTVSYLLAGNASWLTIDAATGTLSGTPSAANRGLVSFLVEANDQLGASSPLILQVFVSGTPDNRPPLLVNPTIEPAAPIDGDVVKMGVTYFDPDGDYPTFVSVTVDGTAYTMAPVTLEDVNTSDGKAYTYSLALPHGAHAISFQASDGAPSHADTTLAVALAVAPDSLRSLNNWFLALMASVALTLVVVLYVRTRAPSKSQKKPEALPEDHATFIEGAALKRIEPQPPMVKKPKDKEEALAQEVDERADEAAKVERKAARKLGRRSEEE
jgi:hypothetical protein